MVFMPTKHKIYWDSAECDTCSTNYQQRLTLESWYTNSEQEPNYEPMPTDTCTLQNDDSYMTSIETDIPQKTIDGK